MRRPLPHQIGKKIYLIFPQFFYSFLFFLIVLRGKNFIHPPFIAGGSAEHTAHQMIMTVRMSERMQRIVRIHSKVFRRNKDCSTGSQRNITSIIPHSSRTHCRCCIISGSGGDLYLGRKSQRFRQLRFQSSYRLITFIKIRKLISGNPGNIHHLAGPATVLHIQKQHPGSIRIIGTVNA